MAPKEHQKTKDKEEAPKPKVGNKRASANEAVPEAEDAPSPPKRRTIEETLAEDVPVGAHPTYGNKVTAFNAQAPALRVSIIREVNQYTRTLVTESELRILDAIKALVAPLTTPHAAAEPQAPEGKSTGDGPAAKDDKPGTSPPSGPAPIVEEETKDADKSSQGQPQAPDAENKLEPETKAGDATTDAKPEAEKVYPNAFDYPQIANEAGGSAFVKLRKYWTFHRAVLGNQTYRSLISHQQIQDDLVFDSINCITEAHTRQYNSNAFVLWTAEALDNWILSVTMPQYGPYNPANYSVSRSGADMLVTPFFISDWFLEGRPHGPKIHTILLACARITPSKHKVTVYDSATHIYNLEEQRPAAWEAIITTMLRAVGWMAALDSIEFVYQASPAQEGGSMTCGLWTIINGWVAAMGLDINPTFPVFEDKAKAADRKAWIGRFYLEARRVINLALCGHADSAFIYHWLLNRKYIKAHVEQDDGSEVPQPSSSTLVRKFDRTWTVASKFTFEDMRANPTASHSDVPHQRPDHNHTVSTIEPRAQVTNPELQAIVDDPNVAHRFFITQADGTEFCSLTPAEHQRRRNLNTAS